MKRNLIHMYNIILPFYNYNYKFFSMCLDFILSYKFLIWDSLENRIGAIMEGANSKLSCNSDFFSHMNCEI